MRSNTRTPMRYGRPPGICTAAILRPRPKNIRTPMRRLILAAALLLLAAPPAALAQRLALVIGNGAYRSVPALANPPRDARAVAEALGGLGFRVEMLLDADRAAMIAALRRLAEAATGAEAALLFYAGHAVEIAGGNMLVPVTAPPQAGALEREAVRFDEVERLLEGRAAATLLFLDSCRDNPFSGQAAAPAAEDRGIGQAAAARSGTAAAQGRQTRSVGRGLAGIASASGMLIAFATAPGRVALDGDGANSPFTTALLHHLATQDLEVRQMLGRVRRAVREATGGQQIPWDNSSLEGEFYFASSIPVRTAAAAPVAPPAAAGPRRPPSALPADLAAPTAAPPLPSSVPRRPVDPAPQVERAVPPAEYLRAVAGNTVEYFLGYNGRVRSYNAEDGRVFTAWGYKKPDYDHGRVSAEGDRVCERHRLFQNGRRICSTPLRDGESWALLGEDGRRLDLSIRRGDPYGLFR